MRTTRAEIEPELPWSLRWPLLETLSLQARKRDSLDEIALPEDEYQQRWNHGKRGDRHHPRPVGQVGIVSCQQADTDDDRTHRIGVGHDQWPHEHVVRVD